MKTLFIHRSVGNNLIQDSSFYQLLTNSGLKDEFDDYNNNDGVLRNRNGNNNLGLKFPNDNTKPADYAELFSEQGSKDYKELYDFVMKYDQIIIKSCYPNSNIKSISELDRTKKHYTQIATHFVQLGKKLIIMTSPPLRPTSTTPESASRARNLADWLALENFGSNISVFDFFSLLASDGNVLKKEYRRLIWLDNHPNAKASREVAPKLVAKIV